MSRVRIILVDEHAVVRAGYRVLLRDVPESRWSGKRRAVRGLTGSMSISRTTSWSWIFRFREWAASKRSDRIVARDADARILVFSMHDDVALVDQALRAGAQGYITKRSAPHVLTEAIREVAGGGGYLERELEGALARESTGQDRLSRLSPREFGIFCMLAEGLSAAEIAQRLFLSAKTVANYGTLIKRKLGARNQAELVHLALGRAVTMPGAKAPER